MLDDFWTEGDTGAAILPEPHPCGHTAREQGCGGCDPGAGFVIDENGIVQLAPGETDAMIFDDVTIFDPDLGESVPMVPRILSLGIDPLNQGRRHIAGSLTIG